MNRMDQRDAQEWVNQRANALYDHYESLDDAVGKDVRSPTYISETKTRAWEQARQEWGEQHHEYTAE